jgi:hypothetical protein
MSTSSSRLGDHSLQIVNLPLRTSEGTEPLLCQFSGTLVLAVSQQFDHTTLIGSQASDFSDDLPDEGGAFALETFSAADARLRCDGGDFL